MASWSNICRGMEAPVNPKIQVMKALLVRSRLCTIYLSIVKASHDVLGAMWLVRGK